MPSKIGGTLLKDRACIAIFSRHEHHHPPPRLPLILAAAELTVSQYVTGPYEIRVQSDEPGAFDGGSRMEFWNRQTATLVGAAADTYTPPGAEPGNMVHCHFPR